MAQAARLSLRLQKEIKQLASDPPHGVSLLLPPESSGLSSSSLTNIEANIRGPEDTVYSNGIFNIKVQIPERYPFQPPNVTFTTSIYHPNIDNGGRICLDILNLPPKGAWQPSMSISSVLMSIRLLLSEPNPDDGLMAEASREYKYNRQSFDEKARLWSEKYAKPSSAGRRDDETVITNLILPPAEAVRTNTFTEKSFKDRERSRKKLRLSGKTVQQSCFSPAISNGDDKENLIPIRQISESHKEMGLYSSDLSDNAGEKAVKASSEEPNQVEARPNPLESIIVSDSEESEDEGNKPLRARLSFLRKKHAGYCRG